MLTRTELRTVPRSRRESVGVNTRPSLDNWQEPSASRWAFRNIEEVLPTASVSQVPVERRGHSVGFVGLGEIPGLKDLLDATSTDALVIARGAEILGEYYAPGFGPDDRHLLMSVSKSLCGIVVGTLIDDGLVKPDELASHYVPEFEGSAFGGATVRHLLDMTVAVAYSEEYTDPSSEVQAHDRSGGWRDSREGDPADVYEFLTGLRATGAHGLKFQYCSAVTDALAWLVESVTELRYAEALSERLWSRLGCEREARISVDRGGFAFANGGVSCTARDLSKVGRMMLDGGLAEGARVVSEAWVDETMAGSDPSLTVEAGKREVFPTFTYRNQWWSTGDDRGSVHAVGIHGQYLWLDPMTGTVIVKFSSEPDPVSFESSRKNVEIFSRIVESVSRR